MTVYEQLKALSTKVSDMEVYIVEMKDLIDKGICRGPDGAADYIDDIHDIYNRYKKRVDNG